MAHEIDYKIYGSDMQFVERKEGRGIASGEFNRLGLVITVGLIV